MKPQTNIISHRMQLFKEKLVKAPSFTNFIQSNSSYERLPQWLKTRIPDNKNYLELKTKLKSLNLNTVCVEAKCPNIGECWGGNEYNTSTATIMLMGNECTRACRFCSVKTSRKPSPLDPLEPYNTAKAINKMNLDYVVLTSVDRDDLVDFGAKHFSKTVELLKLNNSNIIVECLTGDFQGKFDLVDVVCKSNLDVFAHNLETVERLTPYVRDRRATYQTSLKVLEHVKRSHPKIITKSSIMVGLGETETEIEESLKDLKNHCVDVVTLGQYMRPTKGHLKVVEYIKPEKFEYWKNLALSKYNFKYCASGPLVRSSYRAGEYYIKNVLLNKENQNKLDI